MNRMIKKLLITGAVIGTCALILYPSLKNRLLEDIEYLKKLVLKKFEMENNITLEDILNKAKEYENSIGKEGESDVTNIENAANFYIFALEKFTQFSQTKFEDLCENTSVKEKVFDFLKTKKGNNSKTKEGNNLKTGD